ncbi:MAG: alcohol dehydrogenase catalytic domain-containing protein [Deltaproteobacteria bacterium]|nr:alcohol dehydrogenase catalytic domain-containing protein [Deltaproteobacteria bacterium]
MKAAYYQGNRTIKIGESIQRPPGPNEVRLKVAYCGVCGTDLHIFKGDMDKRITMPQVVGHEMAGEIAEVGTNVKSWSVGERVVVRPLDPCGNCPACRAGLAHICYNLKFLGIDTPGAFQGSWTVPAHTLHRLPPALPLDQAALIEPLAVACHDVRRGEVQSGEEVVVIGGGPIGLLIAMVAAHIGARVLISELNPFRLNLAREIGLEAINPQEADLAAWVGKRSDGAGADVVFEVSGSAAGAATMTQLARTRGRIVIVAIFAELPKVDLFRFFWRELHLCGARVYEPEDFEKAIALAAMGVLPLGRLISDRRPLADLQRVFEQIEGSTDLMKVLIDTRGE